VNKGRVHFNFEANIEGTNQSMPVVKYLICPNILYSACKASVATIESNTTMSKIEHLKNPYTIHAGIDHDPKDCPG